METNSLQKMGTISATFVIFSILVINSIILSFAGEYALEARRLYDKLLMKDGYNKLVRPAPVHTRTVEVYLSVKLSALMDVVCLPSTYLNFQEKDRTLHEVKKFIWDADYIHRVD